VAKKENEEILLSIPIAGKHGFNERSLNIIAWDANYYEEHYADFDELFFYQKCGFNL